MESNDKKTHSGLGFDVGVWGLGFGVQGLGLGVLGAGSGVRVIE